LSSRSTRNREAKGPAAVVLCSTAKPRAMLAEHLARIDIALVEADSAPAAARLLKSGRVQAAFVEGTQAGIAAIERLRCLQKRSYWPLVTFCDRPKPRIELRAYRVGADDFLVMNRGNPLSTAVNARIRALKNRMLALQNRDRRQRKMRNSARRLRERYAEVDEDLLLAQRLQESFLPTHMPNLGGFVFHARIMTSGRVAGDFYDVQRLDESHVGLYVADAIGHGVRAGLLTVFLKKTVQLKEIGPGGYRLCRPAEVLDRLNRDLMGEELSDSPFITLVYGLMNTVTGEVTLSRGGHPYPILLRADGKTEYIHADGPLLGIMPGKFEESTVRLAPGDKLVFYTDGIDKTKRYRGLRGPDAFFRIIEDNRRMPLDEMFDEVMNRLWRGGRGLPADDITMAGVEFAPDGQ